MSKKFDSMLNLAKNMEATINCCYAEFIKTGNMKALKTARDLENYCFNRLGFTINGVISKEGNHVKFVVISACKEGEKPVCKNSITSFTETFYNENKNHNFIERAKVLVFIRSSEYRKDYIVYNEKAQKNKLGTVIGYYLNNNKTKCRYKVKTKSLDNTGNIEYSTSDWDDDKCVTFKNIEEFKIWLRTQPDSVKQSLLNDIILY